MELSEDPCGWAELACVCRLQALPANEVAAVQGHIAGCPHCRCESASLRPVIDRFVLWPTDVLRPTTPLQTRLALRIAEETGRPPLVPRLPRWLEPAWEEVAPGIECKLLATDTRRHRVSMLVRLVPGARYPAHKHAGVEELHLLNGELRIDERKLLPGDYIRAARGSADECVWSESGCTCLLTTSTRDILC
jgi:hypothetical protein